MYCLLLRIWGYPSTFTPVVWPQHISNWQHHFLCSRRSTEHMYIGHYLYSFHAHGTLFCALSVRTISFKMKKSTGHDGISIVLLKSLGESVCKPLSELINMSLIQGIVPDAMKIAKVIPIYKAKNKELFAKYQPISLLPVISKFLKG